MSMKRSLRVSKDFGASKLANCFVDKASASYQNSPDFVEVFAFCKKIGKFFNIPSISFVDLEQALDYETQNQGFGKESWVRSKTLYNLYKAFLGWFGMLSADMTDVEVSEKLQTILNQSKSLVGMDFYERIPSSFLENHATADVCALLPEHKLAILCALIDSLLSMCDPQEMSENIPADVLCIVPLAVDSSKNKLWYFGDTYLFLERAKAEKEPSSKKGRTSNKVQKDVNEANARLFSGGKFVIICKTSSDWTRLIEAYEQQVDVAETLSKQLDGIVALENKRLRQEMVNSTIVRASTRIAKKTEEKKRDEELARQIQEEEMRREKEEHKRLAEEQKRLAQERKRILLERGTIAEASEINSTIKTLSREERVRLREQRRLQQQIDGIQQDTQCSPQPTRMHYPGTSLSENSVEHASAPSNSIPVLSMASPTFGENGIKLSQLAPKMPTAVNGGSPSPTAKNQFSEMDKSKIRGALGIEQKTKPISSDVMHNGAYVLPNVKKYMDRRVEVRPYTVANIDPAYKSPGVVFSNGIKTYRVVQNHGPHNVYYIPARPANSPQNVNAVDKVYSTAPNRAMSLPYSNVQKYSQSTTMQGRQTFGSDHDYFVGPGYWQENEDQNSFESQIRRNL